LEDEGHSHLERELSELQERERATVEAQIRGIQRGVDVSLYEDVLNDIALKRQQIQKKRNEAASRQSQTLSPSVCKTKAEIVAQMLGTVDEVLNATDQELTPNEKRELLATVVDSVYPLEEVEGCVVNLRSLDNEALTVANVNKVSTAVQLRFDVQRSPSLPPDVRERLKRVAGKRVTEDGILIIKAQSFRTQERNRQDALDRLVAMLQEAAKKPTVRRPTKPSKASQQRRLATKRLQSQRKQLRGRISNQTD
jgi:ribosome-associated protein